MEILLNDVIMNNKNKSSSKKHRIHLTYKNKEGGP